LFFLPTSDTEKSKQQFFSARQEERWTGFLFCSLSRVYLGLWARIPNATLLCVDLGGKRWDAISWLLRRSIGGAGARSGLIKDANPERDFHIYGGGVIAFVCNRRVFCVARVTCQSVRGARARFRKNTSEPLFSLAQHTLCPARRWMDHFVG